MRTYSDISSIGISPTSMEMVIGHTNGTITIVQKEDNKWVAKYSMDIEVFSVLLKHV